jgi:hypothetical protein
MGSIWSREAICWTIQGLDQQSFSRFFLARYPDLHKLYNGRLLLRLSKTAHCGGHNCTIRKIRSHGGNGKPVSDSLVTIMRVNYGYSAHFLHCDGARLPFDQYPKSRGTQSLPAAWLWCCSDAGIQ